MHADIKNAWPREKASNVELDHGYAVRGLQTLECRTGSWMQIVCGMRYTHRHAQTIEHTSVKHTHT